MDQDLDTTASPPRRTRRKEARPGELLDAALDLFVERGYAATKVEDVASRAGVSKGTLFLYFLSKEELLKAVVRHSIVGLFDRWSSEIDSYTASSAEMLVYALDEWWKHVGCTKAAGICKLMTAEACNFPELAKFYQQEVEAPGAALLARIVRRGIARGEFRAVDVDYAVYALKAPMMFLMLQPPASAGGERPFDAERFLRTQANLLLRGLEAVPHGVGPGTAP